MTQREASDAPLIAIIGGCGRVGLPLGVRLSLAGFRTLLVDINTEAVRTVRAGRFPFLEEDGDAQLGDALRAGLRVTTDRTEAAAAGVFIFVTGTPVDEYLTPKMSEVDAVLAEYQDLLRDGHLVILRSTLCPGAMDHVLHRLRATGRRLRLAYCPERVAQGRALAEIGSLPQIIAAFDEESFRQAAGVFASLAPAIIRLTPAEAEIAKLMANAWRYLEFAIANQFYMLAEGRDLDFYRIYDAIRLDYPRAASWRSPGLTAGPCLFKDTMQLASFARQFFLLGKVAMHVNEGLADFLVHRVGERLGGPLRDRVVGLLGMTFKADCDDTRSSLSFRIRKALEFHGARVFCHDPWLASSTPLADVLARSEILVIGAPHREYADLPADRPILDVWGKHGRHSLDVLPGTGSAAR